MNLSYYDATKFPLLLELYMQSCEQSALLKAEYKCKGDKRTLKQLKQSVGNCVEIYNRIIKLYDEKGSRDYVKSNYFNRTFGERPGNEKGWIGSDRGCEYNARS